MISFIFTGYTNSCVKNIFPEIDFSKQFEAFRKIGFRKASDKASNNKDEDIISYTEWKNSVIEVFRNNKAERENFEFIFKKLITREEYKCNLLIAIIIPVLVSIFAVLMPLLTKDGVEEWIGSLGIIILVLLFLLMFATIYSESKELISFYKECMTIFHKEIKKSEETHASESGCDNPDGVIQGK